MKNIKEINEWRIEELNYLLKQADSERIRLTKIFERYNSKSEIPLLKNEFEIRSQQNLLDQELAELFQCNYFIAQNFVYYIDKISDIEIERMRHRFNDDYYHDIVLARQLIVKSLAYQLLNENLKRNELDYNERTYRKILRKILKHEKLKVGELALLEIYAEVNTFSLPTSEGFSLNLYSEDNRFNQEELQIFYNYANKYHDKIIQALTTLEKTIPPEIRRKGLRLVK